MSDKNKKKKKRVTIRDDDDPDDRHRKLAELGALPPSEDDDEFVRDVEVLSDVPSVDTSRADKPPNYKMNCLFWILITPVIFLVLFTFSVEFFYFLHFTNCSIYDVADQIVMFDSTKIEKSFQNLHKICIL